MESENLNSDKDPKESELSRDVSEFSDVERFSKPILDSQIEANEILNSDKDPKESESSKDASELSDVESLSKSILDSQIEADEEIKSGKKDESILTASTVPVTKGRPGRKRRGYVYSEHDDPETIKEKKKKRAVELKLKKLKCTLNESLEVTGKRATKAPQRFELVPGERRQSAIEKIIDQGRGRQLGDITWITHQLRAASLYTLRILHRLIYRKQGMFAAKHIRKSLLKFNGFPFDVHHPEIKRRREHLEKYSLNDLHLLRQVLGLRPGSKEEMTDRIMEFLQKPSQKLIEDHITEIMTSLMQQAKLPSDQVLRFDAMTSLHYVHPSQDDEPAEVSSVTPKTETEISKFDLNSTSWKTPTYFKEGHGVKLKYIRAICTNMLRASDAFVELFHHLLYLKVDEPNVMRRSILEFSGLNCNIGTSDYLYRMRILSTLPLEQLKSMCGVLCLPTWHRSRQFLTDGIMDFLVVPRISALKKRVPPLFSEECSFSFDSAKTNKALSPELKSSESEEIEIVPDIHIPDESPGAIGDNTIENEYIGIKLKNFSNIHYQVISTPAVKLTDIHMILYLTSCAQNNIRKNILEFSGFPFDDSSAQYRCRKGLMMQMTVEALKTVATVLCVSQYIVKECQYSLTEAILKFLLKPSALLNSSTIMPTISPVPLLAKKNPIIKNKATSTTGKTSQLCEIKSEIEPEIVISELPSGIVISKVESVCPAAKAKSFDSVTPKENMKPAIVKLKACFPFNDIEITPLPKISEVVCAASKTISPIEQQLHPKKLSTDMSNKEPSIKIKKEPDICPEKETVPETDELLSNVKKSVNVVPANLQYLLSDDDDDQPLSKMIGHPNDDQLRVLIVKIMKESKLEDITMKHVIHKVFETYPNFDLSYRKDYIKSVVRQILSQMDDQSCSVSTTVITI